ncbi:MAG TPA: glycosyltransferase family 2 protein [Bryobacteraceae bacterium]|nr:glycosyltransferase family 2 protein [Bryobacteraceae bacterium]
MSRTGIVVVTYNSGEVIGRCLDSCAGRPVVVVDNASADDTCDLVRRRGAVRLIANSENRGFAAAANQGVAELETELILLLNPDVELQTALEGLEAACARPGVGLAGGRLLDRNGRVQSGFTLRRFPTPLTLAFEVLGLNRLIPPNPVNRRYRCLDLDLSQAQEADQPPGAFLMFRREVWQRLGGFDTQFHPIWFEDVDFCRRARALGLKIQYVPEVTAQHQGGDSIAKLDRSCREAYWYASLLRYASKHFRPYAHRGVSAAVVLGSLLRAGVGMARFRSSRTVKAYMKVARLAGRSFFLGRVGELELAGEKQDSTMRAVV